ncbi:TPA: sugar 3,4-ketoisomerase [Enterobacter hormaechei]|uniref:sugar 3,4-ketoisomerase n=1 Tax=Enterobacter hormaechei TaxID=158836 RepID=UPI00079A059E|nr:FdtA/QdtA family cupin domain-containing protein [Enterobacter hormaechei]HAV1973447.1 WxcM-like domain-containing protein [Enterobacter hormaechei subsp. steigerwaltii]THA90289.1 WxcM-like domain-containing protein [Enterobacter hormaechei]CZZ42041.1 WxcM-like%2C C-terminal [Enterobacter hormaechei]SAA25271.1 WxcM-like%2C C-terminal [Enterobacter hormaechei]SAA88801.1 WxcM-like%2C C-terminal [Enterobacter hormaechei]
MEIKIIPLQAHGDDRGSLIALEEENNIPFEIKRVYYMFNTKDDVRRGMHAHRKLKQVAIAVRGSCRFVLDNGIERVEILLDNPGQGLLIDSCMWREMYDFSKDCVLMVLADSHYDESDYIRDYDEFMKVAKNDKSPSVE